MALSNMYTALERRDLRLPSSDSTSTPRKTASGNSCKNLRVIPRSDQKLWPFRTATPVSSEETSSSLGSDFTFTTRKTGSGNSCKNFRATQRLDQKLWPFEPLLWSGAKTQWPHRIGNPHLLQGKWRPETLVKI
jgi:hypothetical protein